jgi:hypothetical protein
MTSALQHEVLSGFDSTHVGLSKGALSCMLTVTRILKIKSFPVLIDEFKTEQEGQVLGLGGGAIKSILRDHGITRVLSSEGGRTSRGNMGKTRLYLDVVNDLYNRGILDLEAAELFWIERVRNFFASEPFVFKLDPSKSLRFSIRQLLKQTFERQKKASGTMYAGIVMQHLVGAKFELILGEKSPKRHGASVADSPTDRSGDFLVGQASVHVTTAPSQALVVKIIGNLERGLKPIIITTDNGVGGAKALAEDNNIDDRVDVIEIEQFLAANVYEWSEFDSLTQPHTFKQLIDRYNSIVEECETDPSLRIDYEP